MPLINFKSPCNIFWIMAIYHQTFFIPSFVGLLKEIEGGTLKLGGGAFETNFRLPGGGGVCSGGGGGI